MSNFITLLFWGMVVTSVSLGAIITYDDLKQARGRR